MLGKEKKKGRGCIITFICTLHVNTAVWRRRASLLCWHTGQMKDMQKSIDSASSLLRTQPQLLLAASRSVGGTIHKCCRVLCNHRPRPEAAKRRALQQGRKTTSFSDTGRGTLRWQIPPKDKQDMARVRLPVNEVSLSV